jgi:hypothetical protein
MGQDTNHSRVVLGNSKIRLNGTEEVRVWQYARTYRWPVGGDVHFSCRFQEALMEILRYSLLHRERLRISDGFHDVQCIVSELSETSELDDWTVEVHAIVVGDERPKPEVKPVHMQPAIRQRPPSPAPRPAMKPPVEEKPVARVFRISDAEKED